MNLGALSERLSASPRVQAIVALVVVIALVLPIVTSGFVTGLLIEAILLGLFAVAVNIALGYSGLITLAPAFFFGLGAYGLAISTVDYGVSFWVGFVVAVLLSLVFAIIVGFAPIRRGIGPAYFAMFTLAIGVIGYDFTYVTTSVTGGSNGKGYVVPPEILGLDFGEPVVYYYFVLLITIVVMAGIYRLLSSDYGMVLHAIRQSEHRMRYLGYGTRREKFNAWLISCVLSSFAGALYVGQLGLAAPSLMSFDLTGEVLIWVVIGGVGTIAGPFIAGFGLTLIEHYLGSIWTEGYLILIGILFVSFVFLLPEGIIGFLKERRE